MNRGDSQPEEHSCSLVWWCGTETKMTFFHHRHITAINPKYPQIDTLLHRYANSCDGKRKSSIHNRLLFLSHASNTNACTSQIFTDAD